MIHLTARDLKFAAVLLTLDAAIALVVTVWALVNVLTGGPSTWWWVAFGVAVTSGTAASALWCRRRASQLKQGEETSR